MKKFITMALALIMAMAMSVPVFADDVSASSGISKTKAKSIALKNAGTSSSKIKYYEIELDDGVYEIEFTKKSNGYEYNYDIKKSNGTIIEKGVDRNIKRTSSTKKIGKTAAISKVSKFSGFSKSKIKSGTCYFERDDGQGKYEVKFRSNGKRYDYEVQAATGRIIEYGWERY